MDVTNSNFIGTEATGVFEGTLNEDMIDTVKKTKKLYCDVDIPQFFEKSMKHPYTYVPLWAMTLPLKKGDKVYVKFHQNNFTLPVLWKCEDNLDSGMYEKFEFPDGVTDGNVKKPTAVDTFFAEKLGDDSFIIKTANYTVLRQNTGFILIDKDDKVYVQGKEINQTSTGGFNVDSTNDIKVFSSNGNINLKTITGKMSVANDTASLTELVTNLYTCVNNICQGLLTEPLTMGSSGKINPAISDLIIRPMTVEGGLLPKINNEILSLLS